MVVVLMVVVVVVVVVVMMMMMLTVSRKRPASLPRTPQADLERESVRVAHGHIAPGMISDVGLPPSRSKCCCSACSVNLKLLRRLPLAFRRKLPGMLPASNFGVMIYRPVIDVTDRIGTGARELAAADSARLGDADGVHTLGEDGVASGVGPDPFALVDCQYRQTTFLSSESSSDTQYSGILSG
eukprot:3941537-Rhodomonas_salina.2